MSPPSSDSDNGDVHIQSQVAMLAERSSGLLDTVKRHEDAIDGIYARLQTIERLCYIGVGGIVIISGMIGLFGSQILKMDVSDRYKRSDAVADKQQQSATDENMRRRLDRLEARK